MHNEEFQAYLLVDSNATLPAEGCMCVIFMGLQKDILGITQQMISLT